MLRAKFKRMKLKHMRIINADVHGKGSFVRNCSTRKFIVGNISNMKICDLQHYVESGAFNKRSSV